VRNQNSPEAKQIIDFYTNIYEEDSRLVKHKTEFITTTYLLNKFLKLKSRILDVGAGTGIYSIYYAQKGCQVTAIDLVPQNINTLKSKIKKLPNISVEAEVGDARNLSHYNDASFDAVLCLGPICHLKGRSIDRCIRENLRVLKINGIFAASYVNKYNGYQNDKYFNMFTFHNPEEISLRLSVQGIKLIYNVPTDGMPFTKLTKLINDSNYDIHKSHKWLELNKSVFNRLNELFIHGLCIGIKSNKMI
jgi:ubiquinone/menaquinone biosynthesis C-methylase UbiE